MMAYKVLDNIFFDQEVPLYNSGQMHRDWTFVEDIVSGIMGAVDRPLGYEIMNLGRGEPVLLAEFVSFIEQLVGKKANLVPTPMLDADIAYTFADISKTRDFLGYDPKVSVQEGVNPVLGMVPAGSIEKIIETGFRFSPVVIFKSIYRRSVLHFRKTDRLCF